MKTRSGLVSHFSPTLIYCVGIVALCASLSTIRTTAAVLSWSGAGATGNWSDSGNWGFAGTPANGDTLIFPSGQPRLANTNNIGALVLSQIRFVGTAGGYNIRGLSFAVTNSILATNTAGANLIANALTLSSTDIIVNVASGASLNLSGSIGGSVGLTKTGAGTLTYSTSGNNTYTGTTRVNAGLLQLSIGGFDTAFAGPLIIGDGSGTAATVRNTLSSELPNDQPITINEGGLLDLNGFGDGIGDSLTLNGNGSVTTGAATLTLAANATVTVAAGFLENCSISGRLNVNSGTCTFSVSSGFLAGGLTIPAAVAGSATITKAGGGFMSLINSNSFSGQVDVAGGTLSISDDHALGTTAAGITVSNVATLQISGSTTVTNEALIIAGTGTSVNSSTGNNLWTAPVTLAAATTINVASGSGLTVSGVLSGSGGFTKTGPGTLTIAGSSGNNTYAGNTVVNEGILELAKPSGNAIRNGSLIIGDDIGGVNADVVRYTGGSSSMIFVNVPIIVNSSGLFDMNGHSDDVGPLVFNGGGNIQTGAGTLILNPGSVTANPGTSFALSAISGNLSLPSSPTTFTVNYGSAGTELNLNASVSGIANIIKDGDGLLQLGGSNSFTGTMTVNDGPLYVINSFALGAPTNGTTINSNAFIDIFGSINIGAESLTNNSSSSFAITVGSGTNVWGGMVTLASNTVVNAGAGARLTISNSIVGAGVLRKNGPGTLVFAGNTANTYTNRTVVNEGTLVLQKTANANLAIAGPLIIGDDVGGANADVVRLGLEGQIANSVPMTINSSGLFDQNGGFETFGSLAGNGNIILGSGASVGGNGRSTDFSGLISGGGSLQKSGAGTLTLSGNNAYTGQTTISGGSLLVNGQQPQSAIVLNSVSATLGGSGRVGTISSTGGTIAPGNSPGILSSSNVTFDAASTFQVELDGSVAGSGYDQLNVTGTNILAGATLNLTAGPGFFPQENQPIVILNNDGLDPISGIFNGLSEGSVISVGGIQLRLSYAGGLFGNDVTLTLTNPPAKGIDATIFSGNGNGIIDANECNNLFLTITNTSGSPITGVTASLATTTPGVVIPFVVSAYPDIPAGSSALNLAPFQITTQPWFAPGTNIELVLNISSSAGSFGTLFTIQSGGTGPATRFDNSTPMAIPDLSTNNSSIAVVGYTSLVSKVTVSLDIAHSFDADLDIYLIAPDGTPVELSTDNGGGGDNYGTSCSDGQRTVFDDAASTSITSGVAPFVGSFRPEESLSKLRGIDPNGAWTLRVIDDSGGDTGALLCWSLSISPITATDGGGACDLCPNVTLNSAIGFGNPVQSDRLTRGGLASSCGVPASCPGPIGLDSPFYDTYTFHNGAADACITVALSSSAADVFSAAYLGSYDPTNLCNNYLGDSGDSTLSSPTRMQAYSFNVSSNAVFVVEVNDIFGSTGQYQLTVSGGDCTPVLNIKPSGPTNVVLDWTTAASGYLLESTNILTGSLPPWQPVTNPATIAGGRFYVTNSVAPAGQFYRLRKPLP